MEPVSNADKMIAAIDDALYHVQFGIHPITAYADLEAWLRFLRTELADERAAHNEHAAELCRLEDRLQSIQQERDKLIRVIQHIVSGTEDAITEDYCRSILREFGVGEERT